MKFLTKKKNFLYFVMLCFVFITTTAMAISSGIIEKVAPKLTFARSKKSFPPVPVLKSDNIGFPVFSAQSVMAYDINSGISLYEKNPDLKLLPASTTKIITALVALENYPLDGVVQIGNFYVEGQKMGLVKGETITIEDLLYGMLVYSANDAAEELARIHPDGYLGFMNAMNQKAKDLGMENSYFVNPIGLDGNTSSARDLVRASEVAMKNPKFAQIVGTKSKVITSVDQKVVHRVNNLNVLLGEVEGVLGVKTGWTQNARENLVTFVERDGRKVVISLMGSQDRFGETKELIDWVFNSYEWQEVDPYKSN